MEDKTYNVSLLGTTGEHVMLVSEFNGIPIAEETALSRFEEIASRLSKSAAFMPGVSLALFDDDDYHNVSPLAVRMMG